MESLVTQLVLTAIFGFSIGWLIGEIKEIKEGYKGSVKVK